MGAHSTFMVIFPLHQNSIMQRFHYLCLLFASTGLFVSCFGQEEQKSRDEKLISTFQIVRFPNDPCVGSNSRNGTCYTSQECSDKAGTSSCRWFRRLLHIRNINMWLNNK